MKSKECQYQVIEKLRVGNLFFCLFFKEYISKCPPKCPFFVRGTPILMKTIYEGNFEMECPHFHLIIQFTTYDEKMFICTESGDPAICHLCPLKTNSCSDECTEHI